VENTAAMAEDSTIEEQRRNLPDSPGSAVFRNTRAAQAL
jgi:hypothetical protein